MAPLLSEKRHAVGENESGTEACEQWRLIWFCVEKRRYFRRNSGNVRFQAYITSTPSSGPYIYLDLQPADNKYKFEAGTRLTNTGAYTSAGIQQIEIKEGGYVLLQATVLMEDKKPKAKVSVLAGGPQEGNHVSASFTTEAVAEYHHCWSNPKNQDGYSVLELHITEDKLPSAILSKKLTFPGVREGSVMQISPGSNCVFEGTYVGPKDEITVIVRRTTGLSDVKTADMTDPKRLVKLGKPKAAGLPVYITARVTISSVFFFPNYQRDVVSFNNEEATDRITFAFNDAFDISNAIMSSGARK